MFKIKELPELEYKAVEAAERGCSKHPGEGDRGHKEGTVPLLQRFTKALVPFSVKLTRAFCSGLIYGDGSDQAHEPAVVVAQRWVDWPDMPMRSQRSGLCSECGSV